MESTRADAAAAEAARGATSASPTRIQDNVIARHERRLLDALCRAMPASVQPDHLTVVGIAGAFLVLAGYALGNLSPALITLASLGFVVHWFGDSLDGSLARYRRTERPRYGYFVDHGLDAFCNVLIFLGIGLGPFVRLDVALAALAGYLLLTIYVVLKDKALGEFQLSFHGLGPTELRLMVIAINAVMVVAGPLPLDAAGTVTAYDVLFGLAAVAFTGLFVLQFTAVALRLRADGR